MEAHAAVKDTRPGALETQLGAIEAQHRVLDADLVPWRLIFENVEWGIKTSVLTY
jgi:hypothetical protein